MFLFRETGYGTQKVAIPYFSLKDVAGFNFLADEYRIFDDLSNSLPDYFLEILSESKGFLLCWELWIGPHLIRPLVFLNQSLVVGFHDFFEGVVLVLAFSFDVVHDLVDISFGVC